MVIVPKNNKTSVDSYHQSWKQDLYLIQKTTSCVDMVEVYDMLVQNVAKKFLVWKKNSYGIWINVASYIVTV